MYVLMIGLDNTGKSTMLGHHTRPHGAEVRGSMPTIGLNTGQSLPSPSLFGIGILPRDVGGADKDNPLWRQFFPMCNALVFVVGSTDRDRMYCGARC